MAALGWTKAWVEEEGKPRAAEADEAELPAEGRARSMHEAAIGGWRCVAPSASAHQTLTGDPGTRRSGMARPEETFDVRKDADGHMAAPVSRRRFLREILRLSVAVPAALLFVGAAGCGGGEEEDEGEEEDD